MNFFQKVYARATDPSKDMSERIFITMTVVAIVVGIMALIGDILVGENIVEIGVLIATCFVVPSTAIFCVRNHKVAAGTRLIVLGLVFVIIPVIFFFGGGISGGSVPWMIFSYLYIGLLLSGRWRAVMLFILTLVIIFNYCMSYFHPETVIYHDVLTDHIDSIFAVIEVGMMCFIMAWFQTRLFREENRRVREETKKVEELMRSQNRFFSSMSHEIRTPINSILGLNEIILRQEDASDEIVRDASNIQGAGRMLLALVNDILDISKIEAGKMDIVPVNYNLGNIISEIVNMVWLPAEEKGLKLKVDIDPSIPAELFGDEVRIKQILINLLNNAIKYTKEGTVTFHMEREGSTEDQVLLMISVSDTGIGIKQDALPNLFDIFQRQDEEKNRNIEGTGLGLSIVKQLVELMGGKITVNSIYTKGSTFTVTLWQKVTSPEAVGDISITNNGSLKNSSRYVSTFKAPDARVLIIDDNEMNLEVERKLLENTQVTIDTVRSGMEALSKTLSNRYDVIFLDHLMPEMDGIECLIKIRTQVGGLNNMAPVIVLTANAAAENRELYNVTGFDGYLVKPVSGQQLENVLLLHLPPNKIIGYGNPDIEKEKMNTARSYRRKLPILITTSTMCDLPQSVIRNLYISTIPFNIHVGGRVFYDRLEAGTEGLLRYINEGGTDYESEPPTVDEFEKFFAAHLDYAHQIIHIAFTTCMSKEYERACEAAKVFENVTVVNSTLATSAMGIMVLIAIRMAQLNYSVERVVSELDRISRNLRCGFIVGNPEFMMRKHLISGVTYRIASTLGFRPAFVLRQDSFHLDRLFLGDRRKAYESYIRHLLPASMQPDLGVIFVTYVDIKEADLLWIEDRIKERFPFKNIIFQKASAAISLNCGPGTFGLFFLMQEEPGINLSLMLPKDMGDEYGDIDEEDSYNTDSGTYYGENDTKAPGSGDAGDRDDAAGERAGKELKWYDRLEGIDAEVAIRNSGSEDSFEAVLKIFYNSIQTYSDDIKEYYSKEDWQNYTIKVHALKSSSKLIGALELSDMAKELEFAGKEGRHDYIRQNHDALIMRLESYRDILGEALEGRREDAYPGEADTCDDGLIGDDGKPINSSAGDHDKKSFAEGTEGARKKPVADDFIMQAAYAEIKRAAASMDGDSLWKVFEELSDYEIAEEEKEKYNLLKKKSDKLDFEGIMEVL
ncbi:MAG: DegV family EDD domain-containing protein [Butyrivibrio sp.]|nr:DegV family EDD domain-containing protein [Butyrivibrio sp.]